MIHAGLATMRDFLKEHRDRPRFSEEVYRSRLSAFIVNLSRHPGTLTGAQ